MPTKKLVADYRTNSSEDPIAVGRALCVSILMWLTACGLYVLPYLVEAKLMSISLELTGLGLLVMAFYAPQAAKGQILAANDQIQAIAKQTKATLLRRARLPLHFTPHCLRHMYASLMLQQGESPAYVQRQLGHASIQLTVDTYGKCLLMGTRGSGPTRRGSQRIQVVAKW